jgi:hypothetical protein
MKPFLQLLRPRIQVNVLLLQSGSAVALAMDEAFVRAWGWPAPGFCRDGKGSLALRMPRAAGDTYAPGRPGRLRPYDYDVAWQVNGDGFRDRAPDQKRLGEWRVALVGDSFAVGEGVELPQCFAGFWKATADPRLRGRP